MIFPLTHGDFCERACIGLSVSKLPGSLITSLEFPWPRPPSVAHHAPAVFATLFSSFNGYGLLLCKYMHPLFLCLVCSEALELTKGDIPEDWAQNWGILGLSVTSRRIS
ncbi:hypothetical protein VUR80DRAFT_27 [Thermomyces stellatus]